MSGRTGLGTGKGPLPQYRVPRASDPPNISAQHTPAQSPDAALAHEHLEALLRFVKSLKKTADASPSVRNHLTHVQGVEGSLEGVDDLKNLEHLEKTRKALRKQLTQAQVRIFPLVLSAANTNNAFLFLSRQNALFDTASPPLIDALLKYIANHEHPTHVLNSDWAPVPNRFNHYPNLKIILLHALKPATGSAPGPNSHYHGHNN
ncbi:hypothetical protein JCM6882_006460 [Rhodosporidiobolus microsporus]